MRLSTDQIQAIRQAATASFGEGASVWLFGSRADDHKKGGDIDLLVRPPPSAADQPFVKKIKMLCLLERLLGERKIDRAANRLKTHCDRGPHHRHTNSMTHTPEQFALQQIHGVCQGHADALTDALQDMKLWGLGKLTLTKCQHPQRLPPF